MKKALFSIGEVAVLQYTMRRSCRWSVEDIYFLNVGICAQSQPVFVSVHPENNV